MKNSKYVEDLKAKSVNELSEDLVAAKKELFNLRFQLVVNQLENPSRIRTVKKEVAKILTEINSQKKTVKA